MHEDKAAKYTAGVLFDDGSMIDLIRGGQLVWWQAGHDDIKIGTSVELADCSYRPVTLPDSIRQRLYLPDHVATSWERDHLLSDLMEAIEKCTGLDKENAVLVAAFILSTWVLESLPSAPCLNLWGPAGSQANLVQFLWCFCRRMVSLINPSLADISKLPLGTISTLVLAHPSNRLLTHLLTMLESPDALILQGGDFLSPGCATVLFTEEPASPFAIAINVMSADPEQIRLTKAQAHSLADRFQPRLLAYRLTQHLAVARSERYVSDFEPGNRLILRTLGAALDGVGADCSDIVLPLRHREQQAKIERSQSLEAAVLEVLLGLSHNDIAEIRVGELARLVNSLLLGRHDHRKVVDRGIGHILRNKLGILYAGRKAAGYSISFDRATVSRLHQRAPYYDLAAPAPDCWLCPQAEPTAETDTGEFDQTPSAETPASREVAGDLHLQAREGKADVHDVHDVHHVDNEQETLVLSNVHNMHNVHKVSDVESAGFADCGARETEVGGV